MTDRLPAGYDAYRTRPGPAYDPPSDESLDRAEQAEQLREALRAVLIQAHALAEELAEERGHGPAYEVSAPERTIGCHTIPAHRYWGHHDPEELAGWLDEWLSADWCRAYAADLQSFEEDAS